jgi:predicted nucleic acid-binding protein
LSLPIDPLGPEVGARFLLDWSALSRIRAGQLDVNEIVDRYLNKGSVLVTTTVQMLEVLFSTQSPAEWDANLADLEQYLLLHPTDRTHRIAIDIQKRLWHGGKKRSAGAIDVLIAAIAVQYDATVIHYDADYQHIADAVPEFRHEWVAKRGTL